METPTTDHAGPPAPPTADGTFAGPSTADRIAAGELGLGAVLADPTITVDELAAARARRTLDPGDRMTEPITFAIAAQALLEQLVDDCLTGVIGQSEHETERIARDVQSLVLLHHHHRAEPWHPFHDARLHVAHDRAARRRHHPGHHRPVGAHRPRGARRGHDRGRRGGRSHGQGDDVVMRRLSHYPANGTSRAFWQFTADARTIEIIRTQYKVLRRAGCEPWRCRSSIIVLLATGRTCGLAPVPFPMVAVS